MEESAQNRDRRIDLIRGLALLILISDHIPGNRLARAMPVSWGLADMAEVFLLLSGFVFGLGRCKSRSNRSRWRRGLRRIVTIYVAYVVTACLAIVCVKTFRIGSVASLLPVHFLGNPLSTVFLQVMTFQGQVTHLCILVLYLWISIGILVIPSPFWKWSKTLWGTSAAVYLGVQFLPSLNLPEPLRAATIYNPFAWQFLFITGALLPSLSSETQKRFVNDPRTLPLALLIQGGLLIIVGFDFPIPPSLVQKSHLGFLRYVHVLTGLFIVYSLLPRQFSPRITRWIQPILRCSEQSLWVYCGGSLWAILLAAWLPADANLERVLLINLLAWSGCVGIADLANRIPDFFQRDSISSEGVVQ